MTQKEAYINIIECIAGRGDDRSKAYLFTFEWLQDINWHPEALKFHKLLDETALENVAPYDYRTFNVVFGWGVDNSWKNNGGDELVDELLDIIETTFREKDELNEVYRLAYA